MKLGEKIRYLREVEGSLRGQDRAMSQQELVRAIEAETGSKLSQQIADPPLGSNFGDGQAEVAIWRQREPERLVQRELLDPLHGIFHLAHAV